MSKQIYKILIIDDNAEDRVTFRYYLEKNSECSYEFLESELGEAGIEICLAEQPDCVVLDYNLPDSDGLAVLKAINPDPLDPVFPVILLTGVGDESLAVKALKQGAQDYLVKGELSYRELHRAVHSAMEIVNLRRKHKISENELRETEARLHRVFKQSPAGIVETDATGRMKLVNQRWCEMLGYSEAELLQIKVAEVTHSSSLAATLEAVGRLAQGGPDFQIEKNYQRKDGSVLVANSSVSALRGKDGEFLGLVAIVLDISESKRAEEVLRESEERLRLATEAAEMYSWEIDLHDRTIKFADNQAQVLGFVLPENYTEAMAFVLPADRADADRAFDAEIKNTETFETEYRFIHPHTGAAVWVCTTGVVITDARGLPVRLVGVTQNITSRKEAEEKLLAGDERMRLATQATGVGIWEWNIATNQIRWDVELFRIYGIEPTEDGFVQYEDWSGSVLPEDLPEQEAVLQDTVQHCRNSHREFRIRRRNDGAVRHLEAVETVRPNAQGQAEWIVGTNLDVTERKLAAEELRENQLFTESIIETAPSVIYTFDIKTKTNTYLTAQAATALGYTLEEVQQLKTDPFRINMHPDDAVLAELHIKQIEATNNGGTFEFEYRMRHKSGEWRWFRSRDRVFKLDENGKPAEILGVALDITERKRAEVELRESETRYRRIFEISPVSIWEEDFTGVKTFIEELRNQGVRDFAAYFVAHPAAVAHASSLISVNDVNNESLKMFGAASKEELLGAIVNLFNEETYDCVKAELTCLADGKRFFAAECPVKTVSGERRDTLFSIAFPENEEDFDKVLVSFADLTEQKRREKNLAFLADVQKDFAPLSSDIEIMKVAGERLAEHLNVPGCLFVEINEAADTAEIFYDFHAPDLSSLIGAYKLSEFYTEEERRTLAAETPLVINDVRDESRAAEAAANFEALGIRALVNAPYLSNGQWKFSLAVQHHQPRQWRTDEIELLTEMAERIYVRLERARAEEKLRESEERFRALFNAIDEGFCIIEMIFDEHNKPVDYRFEQINPAFSLLTGLPESAVGKTVLEFVPDLENFWFETFGKVVLTGEAIRFENKSEPLNRWFEVFASRIGNGNRRRVAIVFNNITDRKTTELEREKLLIREQELRREAEKTNRAKDEFLAMLSHELRSPLNSMLGWTRILQTNKLNAEKTAQAIETIARNVRLQNALIEDILDVSRIVSGKMRLESETVSLVSIVQSSLETARPAAEKQGLKIESDFEVGDYEVFGDRHRLQQIINNILTNAIKFTPGGGSIKIQLQREGNLAKLTFKDSGVGIEPDLLPQIFDRFMQADASSTRKFGGLGLGLAIAKHLVELHGGTISAHSDGAKQGSTFTIMLPLAATILPQDDFALAARAEVNITTDSKPLLNLCILLVDDDPDALNLMRFVLESNGAKTVCAESAAEALLKLEENRFDLLISDLGMAEMDGDELIRQVRESEKIEVKTLPAIALTGYVSTDDRSRVIAAGFHQHLSKPVNIESLPNVILNLLKN